MRHRGNGAPPASLPQPYVRVAPYGSQQELLRSMQQHHQGPQRGAAPAVAVQAAAGQRPPAAAFAQTSVPPVPRFNALLRPKACLACRLAHASCDRAKPCGRCVRTGRADTCQPPPLRKRGRPRKEQAPGGGGEAGPASVSPTAQGSALQPSSSSSPSSHNNHQHNEEEGRFHQDGQPDPKRRRVVTDDRDAPHSDNSGSGGSGGSGGDSYSYGQSDDSDSDDEGGTDYDNVYFESVNAHLHPSTTTTQAPLHQSTPPEQQRRRRRQMRQQQQGQRPTPEAAEEEEMEGGGADEEPTQQGGGLSMVKSLLMLLVDEVREMKRDLMLVRDEVSDLRTWKSGVDERLAQLSTINQATTTKMENERTKSRHIQRLLNRLLQTPNSPSSSPSSSVSPSASSSSAWPSSSSWSSAPLVFSQSSDEAAAMMSLRSPPFVLSNPTVPSGYIVQRIAPILPFLKDYNFDTVPFVLDDLSKPFFAARMKEVQSFEELESPVIIFPSPSVCSLLNYRLEELQGQSLRLVTRPGIACFSAFTIRILARPDSPVGEVFTLNAVWMAKNRSLRLITRHQFLYGPRRMTNWLFSVVDAVLAENVPVPPSPRELLSDLSERIKAWHTAVETAHPREKSALQAVVDAADPTGAVVSSSSSSSLSSAPSTLVTYVSKHNVYPLSPSSTTSPSSSSSTSAMSYTFQRTTTSSPSSSPSSFSSSAPSSASSSPAAPPQAAPHHHGTTPVSSGHQYSYGIAYEDNSNSSNSNQGLRDSSIRRDAELAAMVEALREDNNINDQHHHNYQNYQQPDQAASGSAATPTSASIEEVLPATPGDPWLEFATGLASPTWM